MNSLAELKTNGTPGDRECAITSLLALIATIRECNKIRIKSPDQTVIVDETFGDRVIGQTIFQTDATFYIPEWICRERLEQIAGIDLHFIVEILLNTTYQGNKILDDNFYQTIEVYNSWTGSDSWIDCLAIDFGVFKSFALDEIKNVFNA